VASGALISPATSASVVASRHSCARSRKRRSEEFLPRSGCRTAPGCVHLEVCGANSLGATRSCPFPPIGLLTALAAVDQSGCSLLPVAAARSAETSEGRSPRACNRGEDRRAPTHRSHQRQAGRNLRVRARAVVELLLVVSGDELSRCLARPLVLVGAVACRRGRPRSALPRPERRPALPSHQPAIPDGARNVIRRPNRTPLAHTFGPLGGRPQLAPPHRVLLLSGRRVPPRRPISRTAGVFPPFRLWRRCESGWFGDGAPPGSWGRHFVQRRAVRHLGWAARRLVRWRSARCATATTQSDECAERSRG
jgi:hypothetical protein